MALAKKYLAPALLAGLLALAFFAPFGWPCPVRLVAGVPCPACGLTRATRSVLHGDFAAATHMHPLVWLVVPVVALFVSVETIGYLRTQQWGASRRIKGGNVLMLVTAALMFALWLARFWGAFGGPAPV